MKYKVGDEVMVKAKITSVLGTAYTADCSCGNFYLKNEDILHEPQMTAEEAWEIAKKLFADYSNTELDEIFGKGWSFPKLMELTPQEVKVKIEALEAEKEIKVGDVVKVGCYTGLVVSDDNMDDSYDILFSDGGTSKINIKDLKKTGRHIDIEGILKQIGGTDV